MKPESQRIEIAKWMGWSQCFISSSFGGIQGIPPKPSPLYGPAPALTQEDKRQWYWIPDYLEDLNAINGAEQNLNPQQRTGFADWLQHHIGLKDFEPDKHEELDFFGMIHATAAQRAEALLRCLDLWKEDKCEP